MNLNVSLREDKHSNHGKWVNNPEFGDSVTIKNGEVPVFWPCGVTPQSVVMNVKPRIVITHSPGHMLITDIKNEDLKE